MKIKNAFLLIFIMIITQGIVSAAAKKSPGLRSPLYPFKASPVNEPKNVLQRKKEIAALLEKSLQRCLKYRARAESHPLKDQQFERVIEVKNNIEQLQESLRSEEVREELWIKDTKLLDQCQEVLQEIALIQAAANLEDGPEIEALRSNSKYVIVSGVVLACLGKYVLRKNKNARIAKEPLVAGAGAAVLLTEEEKKARAKKIQIPFLKKYSPTEFCDAIELGIAVGALILGIIL